MKQRNALLLRLASLLVRAVVVVVILAVALGIFFTLKSMRVEPKREAAVQTGLPVRTIVATPVEVPRLWQGYGTARSMNTATISSEIRARVTHRPETIEAGVRVAEGDLIVRLDTADAISRVQSAESSIASFEAQIENIDAQEERLSEQVEFAQEEREINARNLERVRSAYESGAGTESDIDAAVARLRQSDRALAALQQQLEVLPARRSEIRALQSRARADLALAQEDVERATIVAPMAGTLQDVMVEEGELLSVGQEVARIVSLTRLEVPLRMPISAAATVRVGDQAELSSDGPVSMSWAGTVSRIAPEADASSRTMTVFVEVEQNPDAIGLGQSVLLPGQFVVGRIETSERSEKIVVPRRAISGDRVMMVTPGEEGTSLAAPSDVRVSHYINARFEAIEPDETEWAVLDAGVDPGERVIISNLDVLVGGMLIDPAEAAVGASAEREGERAREPVRSGS